MYSQKEIRELVKKIQEVSGPDKVYLFGSYASGRARENSDVDICIIKNDFAAKSEELLKVKKMILNVDKPVDILLFKEADFTKRQNIWGSVQYEVFHNGIKMYEK